MQRYIPQQRVALVALLVIGALWAAALPHGNSFAAKLLRPTADQVIYDDALATGWDPNWSFNTTFNLANITPVHGGTQSIAITHQQAYGGFSVHVPGGVGATLSTAGYSGISLWAYGGASGTQLQFYVQTTDGSGESTPIAFTAPAGAWQQFTFPFSAMGNPTAIARITIQERSGVTPPTYYVDDLRLIGATSGGPLPDATADLVLGQPDFASRTPGSGLAQMGNNDGGPAGVAIAPDGRLWVVDYGNNRVLSWSSTAPANGAAADIVLNKGPGANDFLSGPEALVVDADGNVWIADSGNHRIVAYRAPVTNDMQASFAFGSYQATVPNPPPLQNKFNFPRGLAFDSANNLYLADEFHDRVLIYNAPLTTDTTPDDQITNLANPRGVTVDSAGNLFVTDSENDRVLEFDAPLSDKTPDRTFGTTKDAYNCFTDNSTPTQTTLACPVDLAVDAADNLYVSDIYNHRVVVYKDALNDATPDAVYGQPNYTSRAPNGGNASPSTTTLYNPLGLAVGADGDLFVADFKNNRVLAYDAPTAMPTPTATTPPTMPTTPPGSGLSLSVDVAADRHTISPYIYGLHYNCGQLADELDLPVCRRGGNDTSRYNYQNNLTNSGFDYYWENKPPDQSADQFIQRDRNTGTKSIITVPMSGWVAKNDVQACGYSTTKYNYNPLAYPYNSQPATDQYRPQCGSGIVAYQNGDQSKPLYYSPTDPTDTSIAIGPAFVQGWVDHLVQTWGTAANGGVQFYNLDNESDLWNSTHRDIHPNAQTYDELRDRTYQYAAALKAADASAQTLGPVSFGWSGYFYSARDLELAAQNGYTSFPDREAHGNVPLVPWYLGQMRAYEQTNGTRLLDFLDLHFYPQNGVSRSDAGDANQQALRLRSTRALWDPTYRDESYIGGDNQAPDMRYVRLIPRMHEWVNANYPNTKLALTEYNWGALNDINGALAQVDILGIFGREGVDLATLFDDLYGGGTFTPTSPGAFAFRMFRNYDGAGAKFGDMGVKAGSSDQDKLAIYAAQRGNDGALTIMVVNKTGGDLSNNVALAGFTSTASAEVYRYSPANLAVIQHLAPQSIGANGFSATFPANSITLFQLTPDNSSPSPTSTPTSVPTVGPSSTPGSSPTPGPSSTATTTTPVGTQRRVYLPLVQR